MFAVSCVVYEGLKTARMLLASSVMLFVVLFIKQNRPINVVLQVKTIN